MTSNGCTARPRTPTLVRLPALALAALLALAFLLAPAAPASAAPSLAVTNITSTSATVTISDHAGDWWYSIDKGTVISCTNKDISGTSVDLAGLNPNTTHTFHAWSNSVCQPTSIAWLASKDFTTQQAASPTLTAVAAESVWGATLTLSGHSGDWYWKYTKPTSPAGTCSTKISATSTSTGGNLIAGTTYTFKAYSDVNCQTVVATASDVTTVPGKVTGLTATGKHQSILLSWTAATGATSYQVEWKAAGDQYHLDRRASATSTSHTITGLTNGTAYTVRVKAKNGSGLGIGLPDELVVTPATTAPEKPTGLTVSGGNGSVALSWTAGSNGGSAITGWKYIKKTGDNWDSDWTAVPGSGAGTTSYTVPNLTNGTAYKFKVRAVNARGDGAESDESAEVTPSTTPAKPTGLTVSAGNGEVTLSWTAGSNGGSAITGWKYIKKTGDDWDSDWTAVPGGGADTTSYTVDNLTNDTAYKFKVRAVNANGDGAESNESASVTPSDETLTASGVTHNSATLTIGYYSGDWHYKANAAPHASCSTTAVSGTTKSLTGLSGNTSYTYKAYSDSGCTSGNLLATASAFLTKPGKPAKPTATSGAGSGKLTLASSVTGGGAITGWQYTKDNGANWSDISSTSTTLSYVVENLTDGTDYTFKVRAVNATGTGPDSDASDAAAPTDETLAASSVTHNSATLTIGNHSGDWYYKANAAPHASCSSTAVSGTTKSLTGLSGNTSYTYKAYSDSGCTSGNLLATASAFLTKPGKPAKPTATAGAGSGKLTLSSSVTGGGAITGWQYTKDDGANWSDISSTSTTLSYVVENLTDGTDYTFKVRATNATGTGPDSDASDAAAPADETLAASGVTHNSATLTIANYSGDWYYKANAAPDASCSTNAVSGTTKSLTGLSGNTSYAYKAYSDSGCNTELAAASAFLTKPGKPAKPTATAGAGSGKLTLASSVTGGGTIANWQYTKDNGANWTDINVTSTTLSYVVENLTDGTNYAFKVRAKNATGTGPDSDPSDAAAPADETLTVSNVTKNGATLTIANYPGDWYYKANAAPHASCSTSAVSGTTKSLTGLSGNTSYAYKAYSDSGCNAELAAAAAFPTLPPKPAKPTASPGAGSGKLILASSVTGDADLSGWEYKKKEVNGSFDQDWTSVTTTSRTLNHVVSGLDNNKSYRFKVRAVNASGDGEESDESDSAAPRDETLTVSNVTKNGATLTIGNYTGNWHYKHASGTCSTEQIGTAASVTDLAANTSYAFTAYSDSCSTAVATAPAFPTLPPKPARPTAAADTGRGELTLSSSVTGDADLSRWEYKKKPENGSFDQDWTSVVTTSRTLSHVVSGLADGASYVFKVRAVNASGGGEESDESAAATTPAAATSPTGTLTASAVAAATATLSIGNHSGKWYYKANAAPHDSCSSTQGGTTANLTNLSGNTSYTYKAYSDGGCTVELFTAPPFLTRPGKPATPTASPGAGVGELILASSVTGDADLSRWEYKKKPENGGFDPDWISVVTTSRTLSHVVSGLTGGTNYTFKVRAVNASGDGAESDESDAAAPVALPPPAPATAPLAPSRPGVAAGDARVALSWAPGGDGGSAITKWQYRQRAGTGGYGAWTDVPGSGASTTRHTVAGLSNGTSYRFRVRAVNAIGAGAPSPESDAAVPAAPAASPMGWLARFGRAAGSQAVEMLTGRMNAPAPGGSRMTLGGRSVDLNEDLERLLTKQGGASGGLARWGTADGPGRDETTGTYHETTVSELLRGGSFHLASAKEAEAVPGGRWSMWGRGARTSFKGASAVEGDVTTAMLGVDYEKGGVLMGVAVSHSRGVGGSGNAGVEAKLTSAHPYLRFALNERISAWGVLGVGRGEMTLEEKGRKIETDLETRMGAFGVRGKLMRVGGFDLALKSDALLAQVDADAADGLSAVSAEATRLRVMLEASRAVAMKGGSRFTPSVEAGLRHDGGDADEGLGVEVGGSLHFTNPAWGLTLELRARGLITHEGEDVSDWGAGGTLRIAPGEAGRGLALTVEPAVGETAGGIARLWSVEDASRLAGEEAGDLDPRVRAEVGYGLDAWGGLLTPYAGLSASESGGAYRLGGRFRIGESLSMSVEGGVRERENDGPVHGVALRGSLRW